MFYSQFILAKKGPLGTIWIAAHLERKLRKNQVAETDIGVTVDNILFPEVPIALRLSGHLLLGVVRIYSRQVNYLFNDCSETLGKIKQAFHAAAVDLPPEATTAPFHSITLPETFDFDELELAPDSESSFLHLNGKYVDHHVTTKEQITLQDCIDNNPYLGSSQFGLDERFGDGSYSSLGLDFDEEFWANKAGSSAVASTSTPLLKEDTIAPTAGGENEVTHMDVDDPYEQPLESEGQKRKAIGEAVDTEVGQIERDDRLNTTEVGQIERDNQLNTSIPAFSSVPLTEPAGLEKTLRNDSDFALFKHDTPGFHAYTPRALEACTPDLNQEYCPPDEPSTPALADETSLPMYKECTAESAGRFSPVMLVNTERNSSSELLPGGSLPVQVSCASPWASSVQATRSPSAASFQGFPLQQAMPAEMTTEASQTQKENDQVFSAKENVASASTAFQSFPQLTFMQQTRTLVSHEGAHVFPTGAFSTSLEPSPSSLHQQNGNLPVTANHPRANSSNQEVYPPFQQQGLAVSPPVFSSGSMAESLVSQPPSTMSNIGFATNQQGLAVSPHKPLSSFASMAKSLVSQPPSTMRNIIPQGLAVSPQNPVSSFASMAESLVSQPPSTLRNIDQQGLAVSPQNPVSSFVSMAESLVSQPPSTLQNMGFATIQQGLAVSPQNPVSSFGSMAESSVSQPRPQNSVSSFGSMAESVVSQPPSTMRNMGFATLQQSLAVSPQNPVPSFGSMAESLVSQPPSTMRSIGFATVQQDLAIRPQNPVPSFGSMAESFVSQPPNTMRNIVASQVLASPVVPQASIIPLFSASSGSLLPMTNIPPMGRMEKMDLDKEAAQETPNLAASKGLLRQSAAPQVNLSAHETSNSASSKGRLWQSAAPEVNLSSSAAMPVAFPSCSAVFPSMSMGECETLRSAYDLQRGSSDILFLQKDMSVERIPGLELERNKSFSAGTDGIMKEPMLPVLDKTPILREETPGMFTRAPFFSAHSRNSLPADDDVLASILGGRRSFQVVSTPKAPKEPKLNVAKRPKRAPRVTPKKRKIDFDTVAVLHGDVIRQQLANAEDIRRDRRKAPCTRHEVWGFIRESEGQENFDEPTLPELSPDLHDLYHDVLHGPESRPLSAAALNGAVKARQPSESIRTGESDCLAVGVNNGANELETRGGHDLLVDCANKDSGRDVCTDVFVGSGENNSAEIFAGQLKEDGKVETTLKNPCGDSTGAEDVERVIVEEISKPEADSEGLAGKEGDTSALPESQGPNCYIPSSIISRETEANEQLEQIIGLEREVEGTGQAQDILSLSESGIGVIDADVGDGGIAMAVQKDVVGVVSAEVGDEGIGMTVQKDVVGVVGADVGDEGVAMAVQKDVEGVVGADVRIQERAMAVQPDTKTSEEKQQLPVRAPEQDAQEGEVIVLSKESDFKALEIQSDLKDATEVPMSDGKDSSEALIIQAIDITKGNVEGSDKLPTSNVSKEESNLCREDEEMAAMEGEKDTDFLDEDNDGYAYAEIDYSSDEQDASIQDDNGWSARSRNVGRYLKTVFEEMEGSSKRLEQGPTLGLERLLARKTKREAARMFFETLVLKTKDYIHVEQNTAYQDIHLYPRSKLMKTEF